MTSQIMTEQFIAWAKAHNWDMKTFQRDAISLPREVAKRYRVPNEYQQFLSRIRSCVNPAQNQWFLCAEDYAPKSEDEFRWNEFEIISLKAADDEDDEDWKATIRGFWDTHMPFFMSVEGVYEYYAFDLTEGSIVSGCEPEFEETKTIAKNFGEFLAKIISGEIKTA